MKRRKSEGLGELLRRWRLSQGLSQGQASALVGARQSQWSRWESGTTKPNAPTLAAIERVSKGELPAATMVRALDPVREAS